jgi:hypothetical protein
LAPTTPGALRVLFIWHAFDALIHFVLEGSFLYHCFFSSVSVTGAGAGTGLGYYPDPFNYLGTKGVVHGSQAGGENAFAKLWMVYARADKRWGGVDLVSIFFIWHSFYIGGFLLQWVCVWGHLFVRQGRISYGQRIVISQPLGKLVQMLPPKLKMCPH